MDRWTFWREDGVCFKGGGSTDQQGVGVIEALEKGEWVVNLEVEGSNGILW